MKKIFKAVVSSLVTIYAHMKGYQFPDDFLWYWRVDFLLERYELETTRFFKRHLRKGMLVIDVGANFGYYTRLAAKYVGSTGMVYAFEADKENFEYLKKNTEHFSNIKIFNMAVTDLTGPVDFYHFVGTSSSGVHSMVSAEGTERRVVEGISIDDFVEREKISHVDFLKIDVEGAEPQVFSGMKKLLLKKPVVVFEYTPETSEELYAELQKYHAVYAIAPNGELAPLSEIVFKKGKREYANVVLQDGSEDTRV